MFKIKLISAILLAAFVLSLSACGENKDAADPKDSAEQSASQTQEASGGAGSSDLKDHASDAEADGAGADRQNAGSDQSDNGKSISQNDGEDSSSKTSGDPAAGSSGSDGNSGREETAEEPHPEIVRPSVETSPYSQERDNAEIDISDL